jgi:ABC-type phosphate/phosphonate transport system substrate-binding protein
MNILIRLPVVLFLFFAAGLSARASNKQDVEISIHIANRIPGPSLEDFKNANAEVAQYLSRNVGMNVSCYIVPTELGYTTVWIDSKNPAFTTEQRTAADEIVRRALNGKGKVSTSSSKVVPPPARSSYDSAQSSEK